MTEIKLGRVVALLVVGVIALLGLTACGGGEPTSQPTASDAATRAFLEAMVPHHESAIAMTDVASERAEAPEIKRVAEGIAESQEPEIEQMALIHERLFGTELVPDEGAHEELGLSAEEAGMSDHAGAAAMLQDAEPFDLRFVDEMVPHHRGAVEMAKVVLNETDDAELRELAEAIVATQEREIDKMNAFRTDRYGSPVPAESGSAAPASHEGH